jgi:hypothetical protein
MRAYVLPDARLVKLAGRFVRLDVDTERPASAAFVERFPIDAWPTLLVIDPATEAVVVRWAGTATAAQVERLALDGERAIRAGQASRADAALARADRLLGERRHSDAAAAYRDAIAAAGPAWPGRERAAESRVQALGLSGDAPGCAAAAREALPLVRGPAARARVAAQGLSCALDLPEGRERTAAVAELERAARAALGAPGVLADDRSYLFDELCAARAAAGDAAGAKALARRWLAFLEREAARAPSPLARSAFDGARLSAARRLGDPGRALPALLASERDLPGEYAPPTLLAGLYLDLARPADARAAAGRALSRAEGPRRIRVLVLRAEAEAALDDRAAARATLEQAVREGEALPEALRPEGNLKRARERLAELGAQAAGAHP